MNYSRGNKKANRGDTIQTLIASRQLTKDGANWLRLRMDPYHDLQEPVAGYPDSDSFDTVVSTLNYEYQLTKPVGSAGAWDAHIFVMPFDNATAVNLGGMVNGQFTASGTTYSHGLVTIAKDDTGGYLYPTAVPVASPNFSMTQMNTFVGVEAGLSRVIGMAIEVIDTTAKLYQQGTLTAYKMPSSAEVSKTVGFLNAAGTQQSQLDYSVIKSPPAMVDEAIIYRSSVTWDAPQGVYMVLGQNGIENQFQMARMSGVCITPIVNGAGATAALVSTAYPVTALNAPPLLTGAYHNMAIKPVNVTQSGIFLTGLANAASFRVRCRVIVERAPLRGESDLIPLATPSAAYDSQALELYSILVSNLPIAVPVSFNAKGDWWRWILKAIGALAPTVGTFLTPIAGPVSGIIGSGLGTMASALQENIPKKVETQKPPVPPPRRKPYVPPRDR